MARIVKNIIFSIIYLLIILYLVIFIPCLWGNKPLVVVSGSMEPILKVGGILYYEKYPLTDFKKGDILVYETKEHTIAHRIVSQDEIGFITKGDVNNSNDYYKVSNNQVLGKGTNWSIPYVGYYADYIYHHKYLIVIVIGIVAIDYYLEKRKEDEKHEKNEKDNTNN